MANKKQEKSVADVLLDSAESSGKSMAGAVKALFGDAGNRRAVTDDTAASDAASGMTREQALAEWDRKKRGGR